MFEDRTRKLGFIKKNTRKPKLYTQYDTVSNTGHKTLHSQRTLASVCYF